MLVDIPAFVWPRVPAGTNGSTNTLNAAGSRLGSVFILPPQATNKSITKVLWRCATVTTSQPTRVGLYTVDASGNPTSTGYAGSAYATRATVTATTFTETLATPTTASSTLAGDKMAVVIEPDSGTPNYGITGASASANAQLSPTLQKYTGSWASTAGALACALQCSDGSFLPLHTLPPYGASANNLTSSSNPREMGMRWTLPFRCRAVGAFIYGGALAASAAFAAALYAYGNQVAISPTINVTEFITGGGQGSWLPFTAPAILEAGTVATLGVQGLGSGNVPMNYIAGLAAGEEVAYGYPLGCKYVSRASLGSTAFTETSGRVIPIGLIIDQIDDGRRLRGRRGL